MILAACIILFTSSAVTFIGSGCSESSAVQEASGGELLYDPKVYDEYRKTKRAGRLNNENHS
ncbi:TPA: hypothetical protein MDK70_001810 [Escherichia coli]|nr:hypothetical protein [Escherichia coli]